MNESIYYIVDDINSAIADNKQISFKYFDWNEEKKKVLRHGGKLYTVSPWALTWDDENYYMIAFESESEKIKHYRVDKMVGISILENSRDGKSQFKNFDMALYSKKTFGMFGGDDAQVTLLCKNELAGVIIDRFGQDTAIIKKDDDCFEITVKVAVSPLFLTWLMNFGADIKIISPQNVIDEFKNIAKTALSSYE